MCPLRSSEFDVEFNRNVRHDFRKYLLLRSKRSCLSEEAILWTVYKMEGYKRHKKVKYGECISHIIVMFTDFYAALEATARLNQMNCGLTAVLVDEMLRDWFNYEKKTCSEPPCSLTIVDIIGSPPLNLNFLKSNIIKTIFQDFGAPYLMPYTAALNVPHMQVLFSSMTAALAACIAFGEWYCLEEKADCFFYRVRISPSVKEEKLIKNCGGTPLEAFKLSYFIILKTEPVNDRPSKLSINNTHKSYPPAQDSNAHEANLFDHRMPLLYFPIIAANPCYGPALTSNKLNVDYQAALLNLQTLSARPVVAIPYVETGNNTTLPSKDSERTAEPRYDDIQSLPSDAYTNNTDFQSRISNSLRTRGNRRRATRVFERRK